MNLEHHRKQAKRLLRAVKAGDVAARARAAASSDERTRAAAVIDARARAAASLDERARAAAVIDPRARAGGVPDDQALGRFQLSDALHVIAREQGYRSWPELKAASQQPRRENDPDRIETTIDTGLEYRPGDPVVVRVVRRGHRTWVSDDGAAFERAGRPAAWHAAAGRVEQELVVNFSRGGVISLPVVAVGPSEERIVRRIGEASRAFYQELLELS